MKCQKVHPARLHLYPPRNSPRLPSKPGEGLKDKFSFPCVGSVGSLQHDVYSQITTLVLALSYWTGYIRTALQSQTHICIYLCLHCTRVYIYINMYICKFIFKHAQNLHPGFASYNFDHVYKQYYCTLYHPKGLLVGWKINHV